MIRSVQLSSECGSRRCVAHVDTLVAVDAVVDHGTNHTLRTREPAVPLVGPLHWRARALAFRQPQVIADSDLVAVLHHRRAGQREEQAERELEPLAVVAQHRRQSSPDPAVVQLHALVGTEFREHPLALLLCEPSQIQLVVAAEELHPLRVRRPLARLFERPHQRIEIGGRECVKQPLIDREVQHHLQPFALVAEVLHALVGRHVGFGKQDRLARSPLQKVAHLLQQVEVLLVLDPRALLLDEEGHGIHAEARHSQLQPEAHDLLNLGAHVRMPRVQVRLVLVEAVEVVPGRRGDRGPTWSSALRERRCRPCGSSGARSAHTYQSR